MKSKDQILLENLYKKVCESNTDRVNYQEDALQNPKDFELVLNLLVDEDWDGNATYHTIAYLYKNGNYKDYERFDNPDDIDELKDAFETHNPEGINDQR